MLFISKPFSVLWIESQMGKLDKVCFSPEFNTLVQTLDKSLPLSCTQQPQRARRVFRDEMLQESLGVPENVVRTVDVNELLRCCRFSGT